MSKSLKVFLGFILVATIGFWTWFFFGSSAYAACRNPYWNNAVVPIPNQPDISVKMKSFNAFGQGCIVAGDNGDPEDNRERRISQYSVSGGKRIILSNVSGTEWILATFTVFGGNCSKECNVSYAGLFSRTDRGPMVFRSSIRIGDQIIITAFEAGKEEKARILYEGLHSNKAPLEYLQLAREGDTLVETARGTPTLPDFSIGKQNSDTRKATSGRTNSMLLRVQNLGTPWPQENLPVRVMVARGEDEKVVFDGLVPYDMNYFYDGSGGRILIEKLPALEAGTYTFTMIVNPEHSIKESEYENNTYIVPLVVEDMYVPQKNAREFLP